MPCNMLRTTASFRMFTTPFVVWMIRSAAQTVHVFIRHTNAVPTPHVHGHAPLLTHIQCTHMSLPSPMPTVMFMPLQLHVRAHANECARVQTRAIAPCTFPCTCMCHCTCICPSRTTVPCHVAFHSLLLSCVCLFFNTLLVLHHFGCIAILVSVDILALHFCRAHIRSTFR